MKRAAVATFVLAAVAGAAGAELAVAPPGWKYDEGLSLELTRKAQRGSYFGGVPTTQIEVVAFLAPTGGSLFVTRIEASPPAEARGAAATRALFELVDSARRQGTAEIETSSQRADTANRLLEASIAWRDPKLGLREIGRTIVAGDPQRLVAITGECMLPTTAAKDVELACTSALLALDPQIAIDQRVALAMVEAPAETMLPPIATTVPETEPTAPTGRTTSPSAQMTEQPRLGDGGRTPIAPMTIAPAKREADRRPLYLGFGVVFLAAIFWWNRRRRDRFDREDAPAPTESEPSSGDEDADDLHAAARGDTPKDEP